MKKLLITLFLAFAMLPVIAQKAWTVEMVPNTRLQSNSIHVSDPDNYLSPETEMRINTALCAIRDTADVFLVALESIGYEEPADFRTKLFNKWGIGDKGKDNGLLMLFVEDQHAFEFEVGYGIEPVIPDIKCFEIFNHTIKPYFKNGEYEKGMVAGVMDIFEVFGGTMPETIVTDLPDEEVYATVIAEKDKVTMSDFYLWVVFMLVMLPIISFIYFLYKNKEDKEFKNNGGEVKNTYSVEDKDGLRYITDSGSNWTGSAWQGIGCARALTFGMSALACYFVVAIIIYALMPTSEDEYTSNNWIAALTLISYLSWICFRHNSRTIKMANKLAKESICPKVIYDKAKNYRRTKFVNFIAPWLGWYYKKKYDDLKNKAPEMLCPDCRQEMSLDETVVIPAKEAAEMAFESRKFTSLRCPAGHAYVIKERGEKYDSYFDCDNCGAHLKRIIHTMTLTKPTYSHSGLEEVVSECEFCHKQTAKKVVIPRLERSSSSSSSSSSYHSSSSHSSGGSFGGGRSGGGGYSGRW
ncbi:MAG: TPM domain-containing protein [Bacteroidales bacterium]|nr:TPM domain-containing protein [Bacteroidales bacterium]